MQKLIDVLDSQLMLVERLWMAYDGYKHEEFESAMNDQFMYYFFRDEFNNACSKLSPQELTNFGDMYEFKLDFVD